MIKITLVTLALALFASHVESACNPTCKNGQKCVNVGGVEQCSCSSAWVGTDCGLANPCSSKPCNSNGACFPVVQTVGGVEQAMYYCQCYSGFSGINCQVASSACASNPCLNGGVCSNLQGGGFSCTCLGQYTGSTCGTYIDICAGVYCQNGGICKPDYVNKIPVCECIGDFYGALCENKRNNCYDTNNNTVCQNGATCLNLIDGYVCQCAPGYSGDTCNIGTGLNACSSSPCKNGQICTLSTTSSLGYVCTCPAGFFGTNGCYPDPCLSSPCNSKKCVPVEGVTTNGCTCPGQISYVCICNPGQIPEYAGNC